MVTMSEVERLALDLPDSDRAALAAHLLRSLPAVLQEEDDGASEALRRDAELEEHAVLGISLEQLDMQVSARLR